MFASFLLTAVLLCHRKFSAFSWRKQIALKFPFRFPFEYQVNSPNFWSSSQAIYFSIQFFQCLRIGTLVIERAGGSAEWSIAYYYSFAISWFRVGCFSCLWIYRSFLCEGRDTFLEGVQGLYFLSVFVGQLFFVGLALFGQSLREAALLSYHGLALADGDGILAGLGFVLVGLRGEVPAHVLGFPFLVPPPLFCIGPGLPCSFLSKSSLAFRVASWISS